jgi:hypothetical protein
MEPVYKQSAARVKRGTPLQRGGQTDEAHAERNRIDRSKGSDPDSYAAIPMKSDHIAPGHLTCQEAEADAIPRCSAFGQVSTGGKAINKI